MQQTIRQYISEIRGTLKLSNPDNKLSDRHIYLQMVKMRSLLLKQSNQWLMGVTEVFQPMPYVELKEVDTVEACGIETSCKIKRSVKPLPEILEDYRGPIIKRITSLDGYQKLTYITPNGYIRKLNKSTAKYDKTLYFWIKNNYIYFPNVEWDAVSLEAYLTNDYVDTECDEIDYCKDAQDHLFRLPDALAAPLVSMVVERITKTYLQIPTDTSANKNENIK